MDNQTIRLNRIEEKLDKLSEAVVSLARMEERMITLFKRMDSYDEQQQIITKRVTGIEITQAGALWIERMLWVAAAAVISWMLK